MPAVTPATALLGAMGWIQAHPVATLLIAMMAFVTLVAFLEWSSGLGHIVQIQSCPVPMPNGQMPPEAAPFCRP
jgi:hypothetical protein